MTQRNFRVRNGLTLDGTTSGEVNIAAPAVAGTQSYTLPTGLPASNGYVLASTTGGTLSWVDNSTAGTTYTIDSSTVSGGANFNLRGSDSTTDTIKFASGSNVTVTSTDANTITIAATNTNTTYDFNASSTTGGANLNLVGSDSTTDIVKLTNGGHITATYTSATAVTLGSDATDANTASTIVSRDSNGAFSAGQITATTTTTNTTTSNTSLVLNSQSTGTPAPGFGTNLTVQAEVRPSVTQNIGDLNFVLSNVGVGTEESFLDIGVTHNGTQSNAAATIGYADTKFTGDVTANYLQDNRNSGFYAYKNTAQGSLIWDGTNWTATGGINSGGATLGNVTVGVDTDQTISTTSGNLILQTAAGVNAGTITLTAGANGAITLAPNGTGNVALTLNNGGNLTNTRNYVLGSIRDATTLAAGDAWSFLSGAANPMRGISIDNTGDTTKRPGAVFRGYSNNRPFVVGELNRGTVGTPLAVASGNNLLEIAGSGWNGTQWVTDAITAAPISISLQAAEAWTSPAGVNTANGSRLRVDAQPTGVTATAVSRSAIINHTPNTATYRSDSFAISTRETAAGGTNANMVTFTPAQTTVNSNLVKMTDPSQALNFFQYNTLTNDTTANALSLSNVTTDGTKFGNFNFTAQRYNGSVYAPAQTNDTLGAFKFNGNYSSTGTAANAGPATLISSQATENWTSTATGAKLMITAIKNGTTSSVSIIDHAPTAAVYKADSFLLESSTGADYLTLNSTSATFTQDVSAPSVTIDSRSSIDTTTLTTTSISTVPLVITTRNVMKVVIYIVQGSNVHTVEALALRTGATTAMLTTYAEMYNNIPLATFSADVSGTDLRILVTPANTTSMLFTSVRISLT